MGLAKAAEKIYENRDKNFHHTAEVKRYFMEKLAGMDGVKINSSGAEYSPYVLSISFIGVRGEVLLHMMEEKGIYVSTGSACSAKSSKNSHVLEAIGLPQDYIKGTIRFSFGEDNSKEEVDYTVDVLDKSLKFLRRVGK